MIQIAPLTEPDLVELAKRCVEEGGCDPYEAMQLAIGVREIAGSIALETIAHAETRVRYAQEVDDHAAEMSARASLLAQYDAARLGDAHLAIWEDRRPGAIAALRAWAEVHGYAIRTIDRGGGLVRHTVELHRNQETIVVYDQQECAA